MEPNHYLNQSWLNLCHHIASLGHNEFTHRGWVMHICLSKLNIIGSDNGLSPKRYQGIIWTNAGILLIAPLGINFGKILFQYHRFSFKKIHLKISSGKWQPFCLGLNVLNNTKKVNCNQPSSLWIEQGKTVLSLDGSWVQFQTSWEYGSLVQFKLPGDIFKFFFSQQVLFFSANIKF